MSYEETKALVEYHLTDVDQELLYYYTNYFYVASIFSLLPKDESINELLKKANRFGRHLNIYDPTDPKYQNMGPNVKGYVRVEENCDSINIRKDDKERQEKVIYHEIHHILQINTETLLVGISKDYHLKLINEAATEYVSLIIYNYIHGIEEKEVDYLTEDIYMYEGGICRTSALSYQYFDNILTKLSIILGVEKTFFVQINYDYINGGERLMDMLAHKISEYNHQKNMGLKYLIELESLVDLINDITATFYHIYYNKPANIDFYYIRDNYHRLYCINPKELRYMVDALDTYLFELALEEDKRRELIKYTINPDLKTKFSNELDYNIKNLTTGKFLEIRY